MFLILFVAALLCSIDADRTHPVVVGGAIGDDPADLAVLLAHRSVVTRHTFGEKEKNVLHIWQARHNRLMQDADRTNAVLDDFIDAQQNSTDACSSLLESKQGLDGLMHDLKSVTSQVDSHHKISETAEENLKVTNLSIQAVEEAYRKKMKTCKKEREEAIADFIQYDAELQELEQIAKPSPQYNVTMKSSEMPAPVASLLLKASWTEETCFAFVSFAHRHLKKQHESEFQYAFQVPACTGPAECMGKDKATCKRMQRQEGTCEWKGAESPQLVKVPKSAQVHEPVVVETDATDDLDATAVDPGGNAKVTVNADGVFPFSFEQPIFDEERGKIEKHVGLYREKQLGAKFQNIPTLSCDQQRNTLQNIFTKAYFTVQNLKQGAQDRSEDNTCFNTAQGEKAAKLVPLVAQRDQAAARTDSSQVLSALTPEVNLVKQRTDALQIQIAKILTPECIEVEVVSRYLQQVRDLIVSLEECPGRNNFKLNDPIEDVPKHEA